MCVLGTQASSLARTTLLLTAKPSLHPVLFFVCKCVPVFMCAKCMLPDPVELELQAVGSCLLPGICSGNQTRVHVPLTVEPQPKGYIFESSF